MSRLDSALEQAIALGYRTVLLVTGKDRGHDRASGEGRGAIRAAVRDWLASSRHAGRIASVRGAHPRHGGEGASVYFAEKEPIAIRYCEAEWSEQSRAVYGAASALDCFASLAMT